MSKDADQAVTPATDKKDYHAPKGNTCKIAWTPEKGDAESVDVTTEWLVLRKKEKPIAEIFHTYYRKESTDKKKVRPLTFVFNGGPGAASAYLHIGGLGPKRVYFEKDGNLPPPPIKLVNNTESWIEFTDLVFIDPVGTGFSRMIEQEEKAGDKEKDPSKKVDEKEFYQLNRDLDSIGEFMERFLSKHQLWDVPVFIAGESYGGYRVAKLARRLQEKHGIGLSGVIAISPALEWSLLSHSDYDVLRSVDDFCTMALAADFHGKSRVLSKSDSIEKKRQIAESFATRELAHAYLVGESHDPKELTKVFTKAADFLGLPAETLQRSSGRVPFWRFARELLKSERKIVGMYDATITAVDPFPDRDMNEAPDPTLNGIERIFASGINHLLRYELDLESERIYNLLSFEVNTAWKRDDQKHVFDVIVGATDDLRFAMCMNPHMKVLVTHGYYDMVTPYFSSERLLQQMKLLPEQKKNLHIKHFGGGHMFYTWEDSRIQFRDWVKSHYFA